MPLHSSRAVAFIANPFGFPGLVTGLAAWAMAALVYLARPTRAQNRALAVLLALEGVVAVTGTGLMFLTDSYATAYAWQAVTVHALLALPAVYLLFVGTLETPLARPLATRASRALLVALAVAAPLLWYPNRDAIVTTLVPVPFAPWEIVPGPGWVAITLALAGAYLLGTFVAAHAWWITPRGSPARTRAGFYLAAFAIHDLAFALVGFGPFFAPALVSGYFYAFGPPVMQAMFLPLLAYGILKAQLFDIDLRLKRGLRQGTVAAIFVGVFFVVSESAQELLSEELGPFLGIAAAGLLVFALAPLQRVAERVSDAALPRVRETPDYLAYKKLEVYRAAIESTLADGEITERERAMLDRLRDRLGIGPEDARALERDVGVA